MVRKEHYRTFVPSQSPMNFCPGYDFQDLHFPLPPGRANMILSTLSYCNIYSAATAYLRGLFSCVEMSHSLNCTDSLFRTKALRLFVFDSSLLADFMMNDHAERPLEPPHTKSVSHLIPNIFECFETHRPSDHVSLISGAAVHRPAA